MDECEYPQADCGAVPSYSEYPIPATKPLTEDDNGVKPNKPLPPIRTESE
jgi:hypothetical protein